MTTERKEQLLTWVDNTFIASLLLLFVEPYLTAVVITFLAVAYVKLR